MKINVNFNFIFLIKKRINSKFYKIIFNYLKNKEYRGLVLTQ